MVVSNQFCGGVGYIVGCYVVHQGSANLTFVNFIRFWDHIKVDVFSLGFSIWHASYTRESNFLGKGLVWQVVMQVKFIKPISSSQLFKMILVGLSCCHGYSILGLIDEVFARDIFIRHHLWIGSKSFSHSITFSIWLGARFVPFINMVGYCLHILLMTVIIYKGW